MRSPRIGIDGTCWSNRRGYGRFLRQLMTAVGTLDHHNRYIVYLDEQSYESFDLGEPFEPRRVATRRSVGQSATADGNRSAADLLRMSLAIRDPLDLFFFPSVYSYFPLLRRIPVVVGIHDTIADRNPQFAFSSSTARLLWNLKVRLALTQAHTVLTVSQYSKRCIADWFGVRPDRIAVIQEAAAPRFAKKPFPPAARPFVLYVGGISPNKNLGRLIEAFGSTTASQNGAELILVGEYASDGFKGNYTELLALVERLRLRNDVRFTGFVSDEELERYYNTCTAFAMPSLDEGFGLPAVEAMACGRPVIVSIGNSLEELVAEAGITVDPKSIPAIAAGIDRVFASSELAARLGAAAEERAREFSWTTSARQLIDLFARIVSPRP